MTEEEKNLENQEPETTPQEETKEVLETPAEPTEETIVPEELPEGVEVIQEEEEEPSQEEEEPSEEREEEDNTKDMLNNLIKEDDDGDEWWLDDDEYTSSQRKELEALYSSTLREFNENEIVEGMISAVGEKEVVLNVGFKSEGVVPISEFRDMPELAVGDKVEVFIETVEDSDGQLQLSRRRAKSLRSWERINRSMDSDEIVNGYVMRRTKGGFVVDIEGIEAFLPGSQIDVKPVRDFDIYVGRTMEFKVVKINHAYENVVVSHKVLIEEKLEEQRKEILQNLEKGQVLEGTVKNMTNFGVFIDLGGVDGLLHITDISWGRINHPEEVLELDEKVNVVVLDFDDAKKRISLGMKQLTPHPWESLPEDIAEGAVVKGKIVTLADYGIFLEIMPGVEGLIHTSEMSWSQHVKNPMESFKVGNELEAKVLNVDREERKMSLGLKQLLEDPWSTIEERYPLSSKHTGTVRNMTNYGLFVELEEGVDGLVHISDLSWTKKFSHPSEYVKENEPLEVVVLDIDKDNRRLSLGHKQLTEDVWDTFASIFTVGSKHSGTIKKIDGKGATVELDYGVEGHIPAKHLRVEAGKEELKVDDVSEFVVLEFNKDAKRLLMSHTKSWKVEEAPAERRKSSRGKGQSAKAGTTTLGEIDALAKLKEEMEANEKEAKAPKKKAAPKKAAAAKKETPEAEEKKEEKVEEVVAEEVVKPAEEAVKEAEEVVEEAPKPKKKTTTKKTKAKKEEKVEEEKVEEEAKEEEPKKEAEEAAVED
ncbi:MAG: 30S ribosomal protein S1 [Bacteroidota bacterium]